MNQKKRIVVNYEKLDGDIQKKISEEFPDGFQDEMIRIEGPTPFFAVIYEDNDTTYLIRLNRYQVQEDNFDYEDEDDDSHDDSSADSEVEDDSFEEE